MEKILIIDDDESIRKTITNYLKRLGYEVLSAPDGISGVETAEREQIDLVISDIRMPGLNGLEVLEKVKAMDSHIQVILITAHDDMHSTVMAMQKGAYDYIEKPLEIERLKVAVKRALENKQLSEQLSSFITIESSAYNLENTIVGKTPGMKDVYKKIGQVSSSKVTVLISGESGTGKELVARSIHYSGITKNYPFVAVNCTALSETLLESELFGHVKGSFTGAMRDKKGKFELAGEGTIFLDEISEISPQLQVKLLRVLQAREFERVGGEVSIPMKARIVAATNKDLSILISEGKFREDLYYRLKVVDIEIPPLRKRSEDIPLLVNHFLGKINAELHKNVNKVPEAVMEMLKEHEWTGNVRELENALMQAVVLTQGDVLLKENILVRKSEDSAQTDYSDNLSLSEVEKIHIKRVLIANNWNKQRSADILQISVPTLYSKIEQYKISKE
ncbi:MAG: sigma-54 dependent transcriptional regulator [Bacteroidota bacterium]|nr:sigma-54 dependent transcriptional regulator [Bacteroidota bacterium]